MILFENLSFLTTKKLNLLVFENYYLLLNLLRIIFLSKTPKTVLFIGSQTLRIYFHFCKKGSRKQYIQSEILKIKLYEFVNRVNVVLIWAARTDDNLVIADLGSKFINSTDEWSIDFVTFKMISNYFSLIPTIDCFASELNYKCKRYFSKIPQDNSVGVNFFAQTLNSLETYWACLPPRLIIDFLKHIVQFPNIIVIIFVPVWKCSNYWPYIVKGDFFHPIMKEFQICDPVFEPNNVASNLFKGRKKFQSLALLARPGEHNRVKCIF